MLHGLFLVLRSPDFVFLCPLSMSPTHTGQRTGLWPCALDLATWKTLHCPQPEEAGPGSRSSLQRSCLDIGRGSPREGCLPETKGPHPLGAWSPGRALCPTLSNPMRSEDPQGGRPIMSVSAGASGTTIRAHSACPVIRGPAAGSRGRKDKVRRWAGAGTCTWPSRARGQSGAASISLPTRPQ